MNRRGTDKIISVYWFVILFIVAAAIVYMVAIFYGEPYDVRELEANALANQIADCITVNNYLNTNITNDNFLDECKINFGKEIKEYYIELPALKVAKGNINLKNYCDKKSEKLPKCLERGFYVLEGENKKPSEIKILVIINKIVKND